MVRTSRFLGVLVATAVGFAAMPAFAEYPEKPITMVVGFAAGGLSDVLARAVAEKMQQRMGQPVVVENRPGANGVIAATYVAKAAPDGYTLLPQGGSTFSETFIKDPPINMFRDFEPITLISIFPMALLTNEQVPVKDLKEFVAYAEKNAGKLNYGSSGANNLLAVEMFKKLAGVDLTQISYKGNADSARALLANEVQLLVDPILAHRGNLKAGKVRALAVAAEERSPILPDVPTTVELGYPGFLANANTGLWAPKGTPKSVIDKLNKELGAILAMPDVKEKFMTAAGAKTAHSTPQGFADFIRKDQAFWAEAAKAANYKPE